jgi:predicted kinase
MNKIFLFSGIPSSGKTTAAKEIQSKNPNIKRVNKDSLREMIDNGRWSGANEKFILKVSDFIIRESLASGHDVICDDCNLHPKHLERMKELASEFGAEVEERFFDVPVEECVRRDLKRSNSVGEKVIRQMYRQYLEPKEEKYVPNEDKPSAYLCDIDNSLAIMGNRSPFDWHRVGIDKVNESLKIIINELYAKGYSIILLSGRDEVCRMETVEWLNANGINYNRLEMRKENDNRKDSIVKKELFDRIKGDYNILGVFDDRLSVCRMWHSLNLPLFRIGDPDADF